MTRYTGSMRQSILDGKVGSFVFTVKGKVLAENVVYRCRPIDIAVGCVVVYQQRYSRGRMRLCRARAVEQRMRCYWLIGK